MEEMFSNTLKNGSVDREALLGIPKELSDIVKECLSASDELGQVLQTLKENDPDTLDSLFGKNVIDSNNIINTWKQKYNEVCIASSAAR